MKTGVMLVIAIALCGCQPHTNAPTPNSNSRRIDHVSASTVTVSNGGRLAGVDNSNITPIHTGGEIVIVLDVYTITVPFGAVSGNAEFWKKIDEDHLDVSRHNLLLKNGVRYGVGPIEEWESFFKPLLEQKYASSQKGSLEPKRSAELELPMRSNVEYQDLFYLTEAGALYGRTYQHCDDVLTVAFDAIPNQPGDTHVRVCALVRDLRFQFVVTDRNNAQEIERKRADYLYDLKLDADVPIDHFLIVAPSQQAAIPCNVGGSFLVRQGAAQQVETVLVLVPKPYRLSIPAPMTPKAGRSK